MNIRVINPVITKEFEPLTYREFKSLARPETQIEVVSLEKGPASIESAYDEDIARPHILELVLDSEARGFDAVIINCFGDPAIQAARELVDIPVIGPCEASLHLASTLGQRISIIASLKSMVPSVRNKLRMYGLSHKVCSIRSVEIPVLELEKRRDELLSRLFQEALSAINLDGADVVVLGCTGMMGLSVKLQNELSRHGYRAPVVDPAAAALKLAEVLVDLKLSHSKLCYPKPPQKLRR